MAIRPTGLFIVCTPRGCRTYRCTALPLRAGLKKRAAGLCMCYEIMSFPFTVVFYTSYLSNNSQYNAPPPAGSFIWADRFVIWHAAVPVYGTSAKEGYRKLYTTEREIAGWDSLNRLAGCVLPTGWWICWWSFSFYFGVSAVCNIG